MSQNTKSTRQMNRLFQDGGDARGRKARMGEGYPSTAENVLKVRTITTPLRTDPFMAGKVSKPKPAFRLLASVLILGRIHAILVGSYIFLDIAESSDASDSLTQSLFNALLEDPTVPVFVSFERQIMVPKRIAQQAEMHLNDGRSIVESTPEKDYFAFLRTTNGMVLSYSLGAAVTNVDGFALADELYGFENEEYWSLSLNHPIKMIPHQSGGGVNGPVNSLNRLTVVPKSEMTMDSKGPTPYFTTTSIVEMLNEGLRVEQFGCDELVSGPPRILGTQIFFNIVNSTKVVSADLNILDIGGTPRTMRYSEGRLEKLVEISPETETILITRRANGKIFMQISYKLINVYHPEGNVSAKCDWKSYSKLAAPLRTTLRKDQTNFDAKVDDRMKLEIIKALPSSIASDPSKRQHSLVKRGFVLLALSLTTLGGVVILMQSARKKQERKD